MKWFSQRPLIRICCLFGIGIFCGRHIFLIPPEVIIPLAVFVLIGYHLANSFWRFKLNFTVGIFIHILVVTLGAIHSYLKEKSINDSIANAASNSREQWFILRSSDHISPKSGWKSGVFKLQAFKKDTNWISVGSRIQVILQSGNNHLRPGDLILAKGLLSELSHPLNPFEFDYSEYLNRKGIVAKLFLDSNSYFPLSAQLNFSLKEWAWNLRFELEQALKVSGLTFHSQSFIKALILGNREDLEVDQLEQFKKAGVMHVMAVSGLHVGTLYFILSIIIKLFRKPGPMKWLSLAAVLLLLWTYALITGFSPSVIRASLLISLTIIGKEINQSTDIFNLLACCAFFILLADPNYLFDIGFQLSFLAISGILILHPLIYSKLCFKNWLADKVWSLTSITISAQLATFPITLHYFNQFPTYFIFTNLLILPLITLVFYLGLVLFIFANSGVNSLVISYPLNFLVTAVDDILAYFNDLPFSSISFIHFPSLSMILAYLGLIALLIRVHSRLKIFGILSAVMLSFLLIHFIQWRKEVNSKHSIYILSGRKEELIHISENRVAYLIGDRQLINDRRQINSISRNLELMLGIKKRSTLPLDSPFYIRGQNFAVYNDSNFCMLKSNQTSVLKPRESLNSCLNYPFSSYLLLDRRHLGMINRFPDCFSGKEILLNPAIKSNEVPYDFIADTLKSAFHLLGKSAICLSK